ncbi:MAG: DegT/DnrJ/EryC1/StrS family aminotransferase [Desulfobulbaceae bacterium]|nr:DegT/DnrJ/EryC1/StrS family aminotransferase [Desulfobulbaceae bacterium]
MKVPLLDLKVQLAPLRDEIMDRVTDVIDSCRYILGPEVQELEKDVAAYCGVGHSIGLSSGTDALIAALMAIGIGPGDLVLTTPYTFFATMGSVLRLGARPLFADIDPVTYNIDPDSVAALLEEDEGKVKAILPVHLYGQCADMARILELAKRYDLPVIEDAAQAIGASYPMVKDNKRIWLKAGAMGTAGCFSFFPSKNLGCMGDGGMVVCNDGRLAESLKIIRVHGGYPKYHHSVIGGNFRLDAIQAAILNVKLSHLPEWHRARRRNAALYDMLFEESGLVDGGRVRTPVAKYGGESEKESFEVDHHIYNQYVIRVPQRDKVKDFLQDQDIGTEIYYPIPLHKQKCLAGMGYSELSFPESEKASEETLALPIYPELTDEMQRYVVERIAAFFS